PVLVTVDISSPVAVNETVTITGSVVDNQLVGIGSHQVQLVVEGIVINSLTTDQNGDFTFDWVVPDIFDFGNRTLVAEVAPQ
ncbi:MAG: Ig-like domain-containing protein, partial [Candidatus Thermoplasmatota archaeon]|nr:Ig-like domain-containing protein [Candidatus Thermoplasmatota archaeon]